MRIYARNIRLERSQRPKGGEGGGEMDEKLSLAHPHPSVISPSFIMLVID